MSEQKVKNSYDGIDPPKNIKEVPAYIVKKTKNFFVHFFYTISLVWEAAPKMLIFMIICCILDGVFPVLNAYISREMINEIAELLNNGTISSGNVMDNIFITLKPIIILFVLQFAYWILRSILSRLNITSTALASELVSNHIRLKIIQKAKTIDQASFDRTEFYEKLENANREAGTRPIGILSATFTVISAGISVVSFIAILAGLNPWASIIMIVATLPGAFVNFYFRNRNFRYVRNKSKERRQMNYYSGLMVNKDYAKEIKILGLGDTFVEKYEDVFDKYYKGLKKIILKEGVVRILIGLIISLANCALFGYVAYCVVFDGKLIGDYSLYTGALISVANYVTSIINATATIYEGTLFIDNMICFMKEETKIVPSISEPHKISFGKPHKIELRNVSFAYPGSSEAVLKNVNLTFESGESSVLVGLNGAGKTTLIKLLCRLYDPTEGEIYFDEKPLREYDPKEYYELFGIIFQDFGKYSESAAENIEFGDINRKHSRTDVEKAAEFADADGFIRDLPSEYDTALTRVFEDDGIELSGGQWQKLSVARAFYKNSDILIMDEPTASLDAIAEQDIFRRFETLSKGKISIYISHRLSSATSADKIVVIDGGRVLEVGTHGELMAKHGEYYHLFTTQAQRYICDDENLKP